MIPTTPYWEFVENCLRNNNLTASSRLFPVPQIFRGVIMIPLIEIYDNGNLNYFRTVTHSVVLFYEGPSI